MVPDPKLYAKLLGLTCVLSTHTGIIYLRVNTVLWCVVGLPRQDISIPYCTNLLNCLAKSKGDDYFLCLCTEYSHVLLF